MPPLLGVVMTLLMRSSSVLFADDGVFVVQTEIWAAVCGMTDEALHVVAVQRHVADIIPVLIVKTIVAALFAAGCGCAQRGSILS